MILFKRGRVAPVLLAAACLSLFPSGRRAAPRPVMILGLDTDFDKAIIERLNTLGYLK